MKGIKCDRCGDFYSYGFNTPIESYKISGSEPNSEFGFSVDLCSKCYKELKKIIMGRKHNAERKTERATP